MIVILAGLLSTSYRNAVLTALTLNAVFHLLVSAAGLVEIEFPRMLGAMIGAVLWSAVVHSLRRGALRSVRYIRGIWTSGGAVASPSLPGPENNVLHPIEPPATNNDTRSAAHRWADLTAALFSFRIVPRTGLVLLPLALVGWWLVTPNSMDRWVKLDSSLACKDQSDTEILAHKETASGRRAWISTLMEGGQFGGDCQVMFANDRVRLLRVSADGSAAEAVVERSGQKRWVVVGDLSPESGRWFAWPWFPELELPRIPWWPTSSAAPPSKAEAPAAGWPEHPFSGSN